MLTPKTCMTYTFLLSIFIFNLGCGTESPLGKENDSELEKVEFSQRVIYGDDDRLDLYQVKDKKLLKLASATVGLVRRSDLKTVAGGYALPYDDFKSSYGLCNSEPFGNQPTTAFCSGFLVDADTVVTAGHCISQRDCASTAFIFDYAIHQSGALPLKLGPEDVYTCKRVVHSQADAADYAVVKLDRRVKNRQPVKVRRRGSLQVGDPLTVIGHPVGLPTKVAGGASVRSLNSEYFVANLDTYGGNSGSAVFNTITGEVEGILVRGEVDFVSKGSCTVSNRCANSGCGGEEVTSIGKVLEHL